MNDINDLSKFIGASMKVINNEQRTATQSEQKIIEEISAEQHAVNNIKKLLKIIEKDIQGKFNEKDKKTIEEHKEEWLKSINVLREYFENINRV